MPKEFVSMSEFRETISRLMAVVTTKEDLRPIIDDVRAARRDLARLTDSVDGLVKLHGKDHDEVVILRARYNQVARILIDKGIASERELSA